METQLVCPNCQHEFAKDLPSFNRTATCPACHVESYMLLAVEPIERYPASCYRYSPTRYDVIYEDSALGIKHTIKEV